MIFVQYRRVRLVLIVAIVFLCVCQRSSLTEASHLQPNDERFAFVDHIDDAHTGRRYEINLQCFDDGAVHRRQLESAPFVLAVLEHVVGRRLCVQQRANHLEEWRIDL